MNSIVLLLATALVFVIAYRFYGVFITAKILTINETKKTPAYEKYNGYDFVPTNKLILFGHHFAAIAGAGPLVGPVLAAQFGYLPGALWILIGAALAGAVHDVIILFASVRFGGQSIIEIAKRIQGKITGTCTAIAVLFIIIITLAGLAIVVVNALYNSPWATFTILVTIPIALFMGIYLKWLRPRKIAEATIIGVFLLIMGVLVGPYIQHSAWAAYFTYSKETITIILASYGFIAAILPVWLLLSPRDYLSTYMKIGVMVLLAIGVILVHPMIQMPAFTKFVHGGGPIIPGKVWPFVFITIACGALSGFHSLIGSGTTPKLIENERDILPIGFGAMLVEGFVAMMALIAATSLIPADYFAINTIPAVFAKLGMKISQLPMLCKLLGENVVGRPGGGVSLAVGMSYIFSKVPGLKSLMAYLYHFVIMFEALFILSTVDTGTRVARYLLQEAGGVIYKPLKNPNWWPGIIGMSAIISFTWGYLVYGGNITTIWPLFGTANQLLAAIALGLGTTLIIQKGKVKYLWITAIPMAFIAVTAITASYINIISNYLPKGDMLLVFLSVAIMILFIIILADTVYTWIRLLRNPNRDLNEASFSVS